MKKDENPERSAGHPYIRKNCPYVNDPFDYCYCSSTNSFNTKNAILFCGGNFEGCAIYKNKIKQRKKGY